MIFYVEDDLTVAYLWAFELTNAGYKVEFMRTPGELLEKLDPPPPDLLAILLDVMLPIGNLGLDETSLGMKAGIVLVDKVKEAFKKAGREPVPLVAITIMSDYREELEKKGVSVVLKRTDTPATVLDVIARKGIRPDAKGGKTS